MIYKEWETSEEEIIKNPKSRSAKLRAIRIKRQATWDKKQETRDTRQATAKTYNLIP